MALVTKLELRQGQQLVMTPQLQQAIRLLQLSNVELTSFVETELESNPLLEREEATRDEGAQAAPQRGESGLAGQATFDGSERQALLAEGSAAPPAGSTEPEPSGWAGVRTRTRNSFGGEDASLEDMLAAGTTLADHLLEQLNVAVADPAERLIGVHLVHMVDEAGYLRGDLQELAARLAAPDSLIEKVLAQLQTFDPPGALARNLAECLALQLRERNRYDPQIAKLLDNLDLLAGHNLPALKRAVGVDAEELADMIAEVKGLNPKPGLKFGSVQLQVVLPDVLVRPAHDGSWLVELNGDTLPRVLVNRSYYATVSKTRCSARDKGYLNECLQSATWLVKSLDQRARTILRVAEEIVRQQDGFLSYGIAHLKPLNLRTVADAIQMHESTVSRVTSNKYMATPRGVFELKYFFTSAIASAAGDQSYSSEAVRHRIRQLIDAEAASAVLSDDKIVEFLQRDGIDIARRTVAKYREALRIPSSVQRRRKKQMAARLGAGPGT
jgi:RNA polymerase sigma-54 factor